MKKFLAILLISFIACGAGENQKQKPSFWQHMKKSFMSFHWTDCFPTTHDIFTTNIIYDAIKEEKVKSGVEAARALCWKLFPRGNCVKFVENMKN